MRDIAPAAAMSTKANSQVNSCGSTFCAPPQIIDYFLRHSPRVSAGADDAFPARGRPLPEVGDGGDPVAGPRTGPPARALGTPGPNRARQLPCGNLLQVPALFGQTQGCPDTLSDAPVARLLPRETFLLTDWGRHRRQQPEEYSVRTLPYARLVIDKSMPTDRHLARPHRTAT